MSDWLMIYLDVSTGVLFIVATSLYFDTITFKLKETWK